ncbi:hypothetical protein AH714_08665 [Salmonella enterica]|nr:hypothetical protein [Salmonella enterica]
MIERGMIFNGEMVRAILDGRKTQTRRPVKNVRPDNCLTIHPATATRNGAHTHVMDAPKHGLCPFGAVGDRIWVRETFGWQIRRDPLGGTGEFRVYRATTPDAVRYQTASGEVAPMKWIPSIHMPRPAARIMLEITDVRVERVRDITEDDAQAEGVRPACYEITPPEAAYRVSFGEVWRNIYGEKSWDVNSWCWVIEFRRLQNEYSNS